MADNPQDAASHHEEPRRFEAVWLDETRQISRAAADRIRRGLEERVDLSVRWTSDIEPSPEFQASLRGLLEDGIARRVTDEQALEHSQLVVAKRLVQVSMVLALVAALVVLVLIARVTAMVFGAPAVGAGAIWTLSTVSGIGTVGAIGCRVAAKRRQH